MGSFSEIAKEYGIYMDSCCEEIDLSKFEIGHASCIDKQHLERIGNYQLDIGRDKNQRAAYTVQNPPCFTERYRRRIQ